MEHFQAALDPRKQELLEARFLGARVSQAFWNHLGKFHNIFNIYGYMIVEVKIDVEKRWP